MWWKKKENGIGTLSQEFISRYWDIEGRVGNLESTLDERLDELERRYKRSEQAERRLDQKRAAVPPCPDDLDPADDGGSIYALARRARESRESEGNTASG